MEAGKSTTVGAAFWTPAPVRTSPSSSVLSEDNWDAFASQMDENGIIGLSEGLEDMELGETCDDAECNPQMYSTPLTPNERGRPSEELSYNPSEYLFNTESLMDARSLSPCESERYKYWDMTEEEKDGDNAVKWSERERKGNEHSISGKLGSMDAFTKNKQGTEMCFAQHCSSHLLTMDAAGVSDLHCPKSQPVTAPTLPHLFDFTAEATAAGIEAETCPEMSIIESLPESQNSQISLKSSPRRLEIKPTAATLSEDVMSNHSSQGNNGPLNGSHKSDKKRPIPLLRKTRKHSPEDKYSSQSLSTDGTDSVKHQNESRKGPLKHSTPDFSKVEPKVHFPKGGYKPPKSRHSTATESLLHQPPLVFKSPADIVKEVLLSIPEGSPGTAESYRPPACAPDFTVPQEFRCRQQATILLEQLQEDYHTLLTKYAEAENTIDRMRLEAKVNLYSDPPKPGHPVQSGLKQDASRLMMLEFPQAQKAEINGHSNPQRSPSKRPPTRSPDSQMESQLANLLFGLANKFLQQLQIFEDLCKKLSPSEQMKGLSQLAEGLNSLERGFLLAKNEHKLLLQQGAEISHFDSERELEGLIFECGLHFDMLKEQVEQQQPTCVVSPSPPPHPTPPSVPPEEGESLTHPQSQPVPSLVDPGEAAAVEVYSASEESGEVTDEETLKSLYLNPLNDKHRCVEQDFAALTDHYQNQKELPKLSQREGVPLPSALRPDIQPEEEEEQEVWKSLPQRKSDHEESPLHSSIQGTSRSSQTSCRFSLSPTLPVDPPSGRRSFEARMSHSSSLEEIRAPERRKTKLQTGRTSQREGRWFNTSLQRCDGSIAPYSAQPDGTQRKKETKKQRGLLQDGIISPETDSGFVGSESSRLTRAAACSLFHQRAPESAPVPQEGSPGGPQTGLVPASSSPSPASLPSHSRSAVEPRRGFRLGPDRPRRARRVQRSTISCSPQRLVSGADSGMSDFELENERTHTVSEDGQNDSYTESISSLHSSSPCSSPAARRHHGNSLRGLRSGEVANPNAVLWELQAEVNILKETLESCLRNQIPQSSVRAAPSTQEKYTHHLTSTPRVRSRKQRGDVSCGGRRDVEDSTLRKTTRKRPPSSHRQRPQRDIFAAPEPSTSQSQPLVSSCTQTSSAASESCSSPANMVHSTTQTRQRPDVFVKVFETADEPDSRGRWTPRCPHCVPRLRGQPQGGTRESTHSSCCPHCPSCGRSEQSRCIEPDCHRLSQSQEAASPDGATRSKVFIAAASPALLQYVPVCPPPLLLYTSPAYVSLSTGTGESSGLRGEVRRSRHSPSTDGQQSVDRSLNRAFRAAHHMRQSSRNMAHSLSTGLHLQELLSPAAINLNVTPLRQ